MTEQPVIVRTTELPNRLHRGKVRDIYDLGERLMIVATDRVSAFDVVMEEPIPGKGAVLTAMTRFWLETLKACQPHHLDYVVSDTHVPAGYEAHADVLRDRSMVCKRAKVLPVECVVRGYLIGGGWREYQESGRVSGIELPSGLRLAERFSEPLFTPSTKATDGHDEPISYEQACELAGAELMEQARARSLAIYSEAAEYALKHGIIIADTKFEFGVCDGELLLVDEVLTPDSSRFWPADGYEVGKNPASFDKQFIRDYLATLQWNKQPPPPTLPAEVIERTREKYAEVYQRLAGV